MCWRDSGEQQPLVLVVEDLHWADRSTLDLVAFLVRALQGTRVLLLLTYRSDEVDRRSAPAPPAVRVGAAARGRAGTAERFARDEVAAQVAAILGASPEPALVDVVHDRSEGNAFFVEELVRTVRDGAAAQDLPPSLRDVLLSRAEQLSRPAQRLLRTAAVAGRWVPERLLAEVAAVPAAELYEALREAVDAFLLVVDGTGRGYAFRHALTRDAVYEDLLPGERAELHTAYAEALDRDRDWPATTRRCPRRSPSTGTPPTTCPARWRRRYRPGGRRWRHSRPLRRAGTSSGRWRCGAASRTPRSGRASTKWRPFASPRGRPSPAGSRSGRFPSCSAPWS